MKLNARNFVFANQQTSPCKAILFMPLKSDKKFRARLPGNQCHGKNYRKQKY